MTLLAHVIGCYRAFKFAERKYDEHPNGLAFSEMQQKKEGLMTALDQLDQWDAVSRNHDSVMPSQAAKKLC